VDEASRGFVVVKLTVRGDRIHGECVDVNGRIVDAFVVHDQ
jgi:hypothetical protein